MPSISRSSIYNEITLEKDGVKFPLEGKTIQLSYYESLLSPHITANLTYVDTGNSIKGNSSIDTQGRSGTALRFFEGDAGKSLVKFKVSNQDATLDFTTNPFVLAQPLTLLQESNREVDYLQLVSPYAFKNENSTLYGKYYNNITNSVSSILTKHLGVPQTKLFLEQTKNSCHFTGSSYKAFDLIMTFASKAMPLQGSAGFLFWETKEGFHFKSIDGIVSSAPVADYRYYGVAPTSEENRDNFRILSKPTSRGNENVLNALKAGVYQTKNIGFNPYTFKYDEIYLTLDKSGIKTLGTKPSFNSEFSKNDKTNFSRTFSFVLDSGNMEVGISTAINNSQLEYLARAAMRYNLFVQQIYDIIVPVNIKLKAGDVINCTFEKVTPSNKREGTFDEKQSGKYVILNLCHSFQPTRSFTSLRIVRDTYGLYTSGG